MRLVSDFYREREKLRRLVHELVGAGAVRALDVGCKHGDISRALATRVGSLTALDIEWHAEWAEPTPGLSFLQASAMAVPFPDATFDLVVSSECLQYVPDASQALDELTRVLKPGGTMVLSFPEGNPLTTWLDPDNAYYGIKRRLFPTAPPGPPFVRHLRSRALLAHAERSLVCDTHLKRGSLFFIYVANVIDVVQAVRVRCLRKGGLVARAGDLALRPVLAVLMAAMNLDTSLSPPVLWYNNVVRLRKRLAVEATGEAGESASAVAPAPGAARRGITLESRTRRRAIGFRIGALALAFLVAALTGEVALRLRWGVPLPNRRPLMLRGANPHRGWQMIPHQDHYTYDRPVRLNELGLRGATLGPKPPGEIRVLVLGDSLVYGQGVAEDGTLPAELERHLEPVAAADVATRVRVVNSGHRGYATHEELALLEELGPAIEPDVVVLCWYWNDVLEGDIQEMYTWLLETGPVPFETAHRLEGWRLARWHVRQLGRKSALVVYLNDVVDALRFEHPRPAELDAYIGRFDGYMARLERLGRERSFRVVLTVIPDRATLEGTHWSTPLAQHIEERARAHGIPTVSLTAALRDAARREGRLPVVPYDGHYDATANAAMAAALADRLRELAVLRAPSPGTEARAR